MNLYRGNAMSTAEDIRNLNARFYTKEMQDLLKEMPLEQLSSIWHNARLSEKDPQMLAEQKDAVKKAVTPESLHRKIQEYTTCLMTGDFDIGDFAKINEFCSEFALDGISDEIKKNLDNLKEKMADKRLSLENAVTIDLNRKNPQSSKESSGFDMEGLDSMVISGTPEIINGLDNKKLRSGKNVLFQNAAGDGLAEVAFDKDGNAELLLPSQDQSSYKTYRLNNKGQFSRINEDGTDSPFAGSEIESLEGDDKKALNCIISANKAWKKYAAGEYDHAIGKELKVDEFEKNEPTKIDEGKTSTKIDEGKTSTKVNEGKPQPKPAPNKTVIEEKPDDTLDRNEFTGDQGDRGDQTQKEDEVYWKEQDIIQAMFEKWFLAAANSATNWVVHQIEYVCAGVWDQFEKGYQQRMKEQKSEDNKPKTPKTNAVYKEIYNIHDENMDRLRSGSDPKQIAEMLQSGKTEELIASNPYVNKLYGSSPEFLSKMLAPEQLKDPRYAENVAGVIAAFITKAEEFSNKYAVTSILDRQLRDPNAFSGKSVADLYKEQQKIGLQVLMEDIKENKEIYQEQNKEISLGEALKDAGERISKAEKTAVNDYKKERCSENGKKPHKNPELDEFNEFIVRREEPQTMAEEAERQNRTDEKHEHQTQDANREAESLKDREEHIRQKQQMVRDYKLGKVPYKAQPTPKNIDISTLKYMKDGLSK